MLTRFHYARLLPLFALGIVVADGVGAQTAAAPLTVKVYNAEASSFHVNAVVVSGPSEAMVIDSGFTRADALRVAANVLDSGKTLKTIFISNADPDFYFGAETLKGIFPQAQVLSTPAVREKIQAKLAGKLAFWGPKMGANAPTQPIVPEAIAGTTLSVDGQAIEVHGTAGELAHRPYVWIPSIRAIAGNIGVFGNLHVWTADTQKTSERQAWLAQLDEMQALQPTLVVPGHMAAGTRLDASAIAYTRDYLKRFEAELPKAANAAELIATMQKSYPKAGLGMALDIGAKVNKGEMKW
ncbi:MULTISPECIES: MBL fold metallo-hydrolase [unclassified Rhizobacter]|uniref:MBL fold metallo-hydrolase n=1 Tax=unclassified Rhizobacter TaxID=2640088 RepID=UPI0006F9DA5F|nr:MULTISPECIES: MBL fold metallo-hydrolase [unclassified Rhizobacter]KQU71468.1 MBL fold metallo-hydrolase [Rhizobacter sp. Root29]KQW13042.1 MBL fold metallo-hydrolase [Rhizobacter sp. Root1238]KRB14349.1 MBL fold metallo-hydrolase [Rhizobacter sp. Root16D2]